MAKIAFLDFDDVLFNTRAFSEATRGVFIDSGIDEKEYGEFYREMRDDFKERDKVYHQKDHVDLFIRKFPETDRAFLMKNLSVLNKEMPRFVHKDARNFLEELSRNNWLKIILTFGDEDWQKSKVYFSGLGALADEVAVSPDVSKVKSVSEVLKDKDAEKVIFIDDNPYRALNLVKAEFPQVITFQLIRPEMESTRVRHPDCDHNCKNLDEVGRLL